MTTADAITQYRADYDQHERRHLEVAGYQRQDRPHVVRHIPSQADYGFVTYTKPGNYPLATEVAAQERECQELCQALEWKVYSYDARAEELKGILTAAGFAPGEEEFLLCYDLSQHSPADVSYRQLDIRPLSDREAIEEAIAVQNEIFGEKTTVTPARLLANQEDRKRDPNIAIDDLYGVYRDGKIVAASRLSHYPPSPFAGLWGGGTLEAHRSQGLYTAMVHARADAAIKMGKKYLIIEAASTSRPIVERLGFTLLGSTWPYEKVLAGGR